MWLLIAGGAGLLSWWLTGRLAAKLSIVGSVDHPNERSLHTEPTPRSGGLAILASVLIALACAASGLALDPERHKLLAAVFMPSNLWIVCAITIVSIVSFVDDRTGLPVGIRFAVQTVAALVAVSGTGLTLSALTIPGYSAIPLGWLALPVSVLFLLWMTNLYNFMDGMDGFAAGMTTLGFGFLAYFAWRNGHPLILFVAAVLSMSTFGFLFHNFPPARIFMGDVGSIPIGFTAGSLMLLGIRDGLFDFWVPMLIFSPFILDATVTVLRRAWGRRRVWEAHREHYYQRLVLSGWSHRRTVLAEYLVMLCSGGLALLYQNAGGRWRLAILGIWMLMFVCLASAVHVFEQRVENSGRRQ